MEYHEAVDTLERLRRLRPKLGTETTASLLAYLGDPHEGLPAVQVAGSNGKGSTARMLARILREAGLDVGLYTSPDLNDLRERIRVDGRRIPKGEVVRFVEEAWPYVVERDVEGDAPTFFEAFTALALWHFGRSDVDVAVLEVGIGGRYDATSVVDPVAGAVTSVSLEHTDLLGETVEEIADDKAHVAPADAPLVTGATGSALETVRGRTDVLTVGGGSGGTGPDGSRGEPPDVVATEGEMVSFAESALSLSGLDWRVETRTPLLGAHQAVNAGIAAALARQVGAATGTPVTEAVIAAGVRNVHWPGRFEVMDDEPLTILDGAHNPDACAKLATLVGRFDYENLHLVFGAMRDKDHAEMVRSLPPVDRVYLAEPAVDRAQGTEPLAAVFDRETGSEVDRCGSVLDALEAAIGDAGASDCVLVAGSLYTVGEARDRWTRTPRAVRADTPARARSAMERADVPSEVREERAGRMVDRTIRLHARRTQAAALKDAVLSVGGTAAVSGITTADEHVEVVLEGSLEAFGRVASRLHERGGADAHLATGIERAVGFEDPGPAPGNPWTDGTAVMGVLDVTPDSSRDDREDDPHDEGHDPHDEGHDPHDEGHDPHDEAVARAREMVAAGADVVDVGGGPPRTDAELSVAAERERVVPVIERLAGVDATISVDTREPAVAEAALDAGAGVLNDGTGLGDARMRRLVAERAVPVVLAHSFDTRVDPDTGTGYDDAVDEVLEELTERLLLAERAGIDRSRVIVDPGLGFGEEFPGSVGPLDRLPEFQALGTPVLVDHSSGSNIEGVASEGEDRLATTAATTALAAERGADVVRVRDVGGNVAAVAAAERAVGRTRPLGRDE